MRFLQEWPVYLQRGVDTVLPPGEACEASLEALHEVYDIGICYDTSGFCIGQNGTVQQSVKSTDSAAAAAALPQPCLYISAGFPCHMLLLYSTGGQHVADATLQLHSTEHIAGVVNNSVSVLKRYHIGRLCIVGQRLFVADCEFDCVYRCDLSGSVQQVIGSKGTQLGQVDTPMGLHHSQGRLAVCDSGNKRVQVFADSGQALSPVPFNGRVRCCCFLPDGRLCVAHFESGDLTVFDPDGGKRVIVAEKLDNPSHLREPFCLLPGLEPGTIIVSYSGIAGDHCLRIIDVSAGRVVAKFGGRGSGPGEFNKPRGMACDVERRQLFVVDARNYRVQVLQL